MLHNGELWKLNPFHSGNSLVTTTPVKFNVVRGVAICREREAWSWQKGSSFLSKSTITHKMEVTACPYLKQMYLTCLPIRSVIKELTLGHSCVNFWC